MLISGAAMRRYSPAVSLLWFHDRQRTSTHSWGPASPSGQRAHSFIATLGTGTTTLLAHNLSAYIERLLSSQVQLIQCNIEFDLELSHSWFGDLTGRGDKHNRLELGLAGALRICGKSATEDFKCTNGTRNTKTKRRGQRDELGGSEFESSE